MSTRDPGLAFTDGALEFEAWSDNLWGPVAQSVVEAAALKPGQFVLDACSGSGAATFPAADAVGSEGCVDAVDLSTGLLRLAAARAAQERRLNITFTEADVTTWESYRPFDAVLCSYSMFFFDQMTAGVEHLVSLLAPGGTFATSTWQHGALEPFAERILEAATTERPRLAGVQPLPNLNMAAVDSAEKLETWLRARGLVDVSVRSEPRTLVVDDSMAWTLVMGSGWRTLLPRDPEAISRVRKKFIRSVGSRVAMNSDTLIATGRKP
ncbi:MAG: class I SAM-dependent methyltransferase [Acidobacteria bacterium]|nr:class I SAM-dependent methyltransferase [Acidobacteriota bacterium]